MKKVLIITYYWPPAGGAGVQRVLKFAKYLPEVGWQPIILTVQNPDSPVNDESLLQDVPKVCKVYKTQALEPFEIYKKITGKKKYDKIPGDVLSNNKNLSLTEKFSRWIRFNIFIPDAKVGWYVYATKEAEKIIKQENIDLIFSTSPPPTVSLIAKSIASKFNLKWIADFRDPWLEVLHYQDVKRNFLTVFIDRKLEKSVLKKADVVLTISKDIVRLFQSKVGNKHFEIIPNGFDETDFNEIDKRKNQDFTIAYTGVINKTRVPRALLHAMERLINQDGIKNIKIVLAGRTCSEFDEEVKKYNLQNYIEMKGFLPHKESTKILQTSDMLLLVVDDIPLNKGFLTGKIFEYLGTKIPIFAIGPVDGEANEIIKECNSGEMIDYKDFDGAYELLTKMYSNWQSDKIDFKFEVEKYSRRKQAEKLSKIFEEQLTK